MRECQLSGVYTIIHVRRTCMIRRTCTPYMCDECLHCRTCTSYMYDSVNTA